MPNASPAEVAAGLRTTALTLTPKKLAENPALKDAAALGVLMETCNEKAVVTLTAFPSGDASMYFSSGGGIIGGIGHADVKIAAKRFTQFAGLHVPEMTKCSDCPLPGLGQVTFYVVNVQGIFTLLASSQELASGSHDFSPLFQLGQYLTSRVLKTIENRAKPTGK